MTPGEPFFSTPSAPPPSPAPTFGLFALANALPVLTTGRRCLHDHLADTKVVVVNGPPR